MTFVEAKFVTPPVNIDTTEGINRLNNKFNHKIFKEKTPFNGAPEGKPFKRKVEDWIELSVGDTFSAEGGPRGESTYMIKQEWQDLDVRQLVVSNLVPSFTEKDNIQFLTDVELYKYLEHGEDVFYTLPS